MIVFLLLAVFTFLGWKLIGWFELIKRGEEEGKAVAKLFYLLHK